MRIVVVDDHPLVTDGLAARLTASGHSVVVAHTAGAARTVLEGEDFDILALDLNLGGEFGTALLTGAGRLPPCCVILSGTTDHDEIALALDHGAIAFVGKSLALDDVVRALVGATALAADEAPYVWDEGAAKFVPLMQMYPKGALLSPQERKVFALMRQGLLDKQIAAELERSIHTVRVQIRSILRKRGARRRAETA